MSFIQDMLGSLPVIGRIIDPHRTERLLKKWTGNDPLSPEEAAKVLTGLHQVRDLNIPSASHMSIVDRSGNLLKVSGLINRLDLQANPNITFLFGDNVADHGKPFDRRVGKGGQAAEMAGEPNAVGIPTLWKAPNGTDESAYFSDSKISDEKYAEIKAIIDEAFAEVKPGQMVVVPVNNKGEISLGTDRAQLLRRAPSLLKYIESKVKELEGQAGAPQAVASDAQAPEATVSQPYLTIGESFSIDIKLPEGATLSHEQTKPQVILESPVLGPIDVAQAGLAKVTVSRTIKSAANFKEPNRWNTITVESNQPIPTSVKIAGRNIPTQFTFPVRIVADGKTVAKTTIEIGPDRSSSEVQTFINDICGRLDRGEEFSTIQFPAQAAKPQVTVNHSHTRDQIGGKLLINLFRPDGTQEASLHLTDGMNGIAGRWGGAGFAHDAQGVRQPEDCIIGGRHGPNFKSASEIARFIISNAIKRTMPYGLQDVPAIKSEIQHTHAGANNGVLLAA